MSLGAIAAIIAAIAVAVLVLFLIPTILTVRRTAESVASLADLLNEELKPTIRELNAVLSELKIVSGGVAERTGDVKKFMVALGETGDQISTINRSLNNVSAIVQQVSVMATGVKAAANYMMENLLIKRTKGV